MPYDSLIDRSGASALMPDEVAMQMLGAVTEQSSALALSTRVPMSRKQARVPVLETLPIAYFLTGDTDLKQTTDVSWDNVYLNAEEIACIVPIPEAVLDDADLDVWAQIRPLIEAAVARALDGAIYFGAGKPASWPASITAGAVAAGNVVDIGTNAAAEGGFGQDVIDLFGAVEEDGFEVNGLIAPTRTKGRLRKVRDTTGQRLAEISPTSVEGVDVRYPMKGLWPANAAESVEMIAGDFSASVIGLRQDVTYKMLTESVIQDGTGAIIYNLAQQDMVAMRVVARYGWALPNPINYEQPTAAERYPFAALANPAAG